MVPLDAIEEVEAAGGVAAQTGQQTESGKPEDEALPNSSACLADGDRTAVVVDIEQHCADDALHLSRDFQLF